MAAVSQMALLVATFAAVVSYTYNGSSLPASYNNNTHTHNTVPIGATANRSLVVIEVTHNGGTSPSLTGATIAGITATIYQGTLSGGGGLTCRSSFIAAVVPTGTTATVVLTFSGSETRSALASYSLFGLSSTTAVDFDSSVANPNPSVTIDTLAGGVAIAGFSSRQAGASVTWTGVTEDIDSTAWGSSTYPMSAGSASTPGSTLSVSVTPSTNNVNQCMSAISFR